ncbi:Lrp/AsnC family transcriptional regulator [Maritimibacter sp. DP1N21-5]|uniref:Lrp/AsnC family transcriptional regulator n=1 Tax=Maritimibacter sp. DP1N21-5 TaxID=2836867 RepID=UPI001C437E99|nr:Lrp/AsnC family transcriptional regulator [Maritimibacter sp. DP1N21-5]MBV7410431.1 Lrp/AsnC family transcriptional regulator [Maritimibacter sp. DP1N21-5]
MDDIDRKILQLLAEDARTPVATLARKTGLARSTAQARLDRMEANGTIAGYALRLGDATRAGQIRATVLLMLEPRATPAVLAKLERMLVIEAAHTVSGRADMILTLGAPTTAHIDEALDLIGTIEGVKGSETLIHLSTKIDRVS